MFEVLFEEVEALYKEKAFLTVQDVMKLLSCEELTIYNWAKRVDPQKRPPRVIVGKEIRFPKKEFTRWLAKEQTACGGF